MPGKLPEMSVTRDIPASDAIDFSGKTVYGDFRDDLVRDGYAVIKAMSNERAAEHASAFHQYIEDFGLGYKRDDPSTVRQECLPIINEKGMIMYYHVNHEDWVWKVRTEPKVVEAFETVYNTKDLIVSFDVVNIQWPNRRDGPQNVRWCHQDQDPERPGFRCLQGLVNLYPSGPDDGGFILMPGAHKISEEYHDTFRNEERIPQWTNEWYGFKDTGIAWLEERGYAFKKLNLEPGDLVLWDSRLPHYNVPPKGTQTRMAVYTCFAPVETASQEDLIRKKDAFENHLGSTHWPQCLQTFNRPAIRDDGTPDPIALERNKPVKLPQLNEREYRLTGIPYITASA